MAVATGGPVQARKMLPAPRLRTPTLHGNCYNTTVVMDPEVRDKARQAKLEEIAKSVCTGCPIRGWCARIAKYEEFGVFAARTPADRLRRGKLTPRENRLLYLLDEVDPGGAGSSHELAAEWEIGFSPGAGQVQIVRLRKKLRGTAA